MASVGIGQFGAKRRARPKGVLGIALACLETAVSGRVEHRPTSVDYPTDVVRRTSFVAGGGLGWRISTLTTPRQRPMPWKIVVITGAPSWAEYWAPVMAELPADREMVVVDRPGYGLSEPLNCVGDLATQALALSPLLKSAPNQKVLLVGQSYGAGIAALMAAANPGKVAALALLSSYLGVNGPTARWLLDAGRRLKGVIPRDLRAAVIEVTGQAAQLASVRQALGRVHCPIHVIHGDADDFAPIDLARRLADETKARRPIRFQSIPGATHFFNDGPTETMITCLEGCLPASPKPANRAIGEWVSSFAGRFKPSTARSNTHGGHATA